MNEHHGRHIAYDHNEAKRNIENGWTNVTKEEFYGKNKPEPAEINADGELSEHQKLIIAYEMKFGKKPHHAMKDETIQAKLDE